MRGLSKKQYDQRKEWGIDMPPETTILQDMVNDLICTLYEPVFDGDILFRASKFEREAINWGDLSCVEVTQENDGWHVYIEEADSHEFAAWVRDWLVSGGWNVNVSTDW